MIKRLHVFLRCPLLLCLVFALSGCAILELVMPPKPLPFDFDKTDKIEIYSDQSFEEGTPLLAIEDADTLAEITAIMKQVKGGYDDNPACCFGIVMVCYSGEKTIVLDIGTDDCGTVMYDDLDYDMGSENFRELNGIFSTLGINIADYRG